MSKGFSVKIWGAAAGLLAGLLASVLAKRLWKAATGAEPPDPYDPEAPGKAAIGWLVASSVAQLLFARAAHQLVTRHFAPEPPDATAAEAEASRP
ncbi:MAG: DUF4235 domain-containing protein [Propionibacteriaceae bacterium]|jgi:hypothetical protein|nr:DUF4235 domain-containing protein [Propionibacteriaceae bacterium]